MLLCVCQLGFDFQPSRSREDLGISRETRPCTHLTLKSSQSRRREKQEQGERGRRLSQTQIGGETGLRGVTVAAKQARGQRGNLCSPGGQRGNLCSPRILHTLKVKLKVFANVRIQASLGFGPELLEVRTAHRPGLRAWQVSSAVHCLAVCPSY